ncbi:MAG: UDP-N-acetylmuramate dehydrogenase [Gammaproteobacteria bacterium]|nr:UDP-N-acetylmuramate dehydrogenase [Gammaproteobacteria bacterium]
MMATSRRSQLREQAGAPLAPHTTWRVGGPAELLFLPRDTDELVGFLQREQGCPITWLGLGSNVLVRDGGVKGAVIVTAGGLGDIARDENRVHAGAGVPVAKLARFCARNGLQGLEFLAGIPGTVGGALAMNAGAAGSETWGFIDAVDVLDRNGAMRKRNKEEFIVRYRHVHGPSPNEWFVGATFRLTSAPDVDGQARIRALLKSRNATQPMQTANAGSVFRNPPGQHAWQLIEQAGLKGLREGAAVVSERHANFIINEGGATAMQIETLITRVQAAVKERVGVFLEPEVRFLGEAP